MISPSTNQYKNSPNQYQNSLASVDLMMISPNSSKNSSILVPLKLNFMTPVQSIKEHKIGCEHTDSMDQIEGSEDSLSRKIMDIFKNSDDISIPSWLSDVRISLNLEQIKMLLGTDVSIEKIQNELNNHVSRNQLEKIDDEGFTYYRVCT